MNSNNLIEKKQDLLFMEKNPHETPETSACFHEFKQLGRKETRFAIYRKESS